MRRDQRYRYLINYHPERLEVHDLNNEKTGPSECQINEIKNYKYLVGTTEASLNAWLKENPQFDGCMYCLPRKHRK